MAAKNHSADEDYLNSLLENVMANENSDERQEDDGIGQELHNKIESDMQLESDEFSDIASTTSASTISDDDLFAEFDNLDGVEMDDLFGEEFGTSVSKEETISGNEEPVEMQTDLPEEFMSSPFEVENEESDAEESDAEESAEKDSLMSSLDEILGGMDIGDMPDMEEMPEADMQTDLLGQEPFEFEQVSENEMSEMSMTDSLEDVLNFDLANDVESDGEDNISEKEPKKQKKQKKEKKNGFLTWLFGEEMDEEAHQAEVRRAEREDQKKEEAKEKRKQEKAKEKEELKEKKKLAKEEKKQAKLEKKAEKEARPKKEKVKPIESPNERIRIPKQGWILIFTLSVAVICAVFLGSKEFYYSQKVNEATDAFVKKDYIAAYEALSGLKMKDVDQDLYKQVSTVAYLEKEYRSYKNFMELDMYGSAMDALLKGVSRYREYNVEAEANGVSGNILEVYKKILEALEEDFKMSKENAETLVAEMDKTTEYTNKVYETVNKLTFESAYERRRLEKQAEEQMKKEEAEAKAAKKGK